MFWKKTSKSSQHNGSQHIYGSTNQGGSDNRKDNQYTPDKVLLQKTPFDVYFVGMIEEENMGNSRKRDTEAQLVDRVEEAQTENCMALQDQIFLPTLEELLQNIFSNGIMIPIVVPSGRNIEGKLRVSVVEENRVTMFISRHGLKIIDPNKQEVKQRHPLHTLAQVIQYEDGSGKPNIVVKIGQLQIQRSKFQCYVYQCQTDEQAYEICQHIRKLFDAISNKS